MKKGFNGARIKDIAEAAGTNSALLNYYFRSKEKLFEIIMDESIVAFFRGIMKIVNDRETTLSEKIDLLSNKYADMLTEQPELPLFLLREKQANPDKFLTTLGISEDFLSEPYIWKQLKDRLEQDGKPVYDNIHYIWNILSICVFPFLTVPVMSELLQNDENRMKKLLQERRKSAPTWIKSMLGINE